MCWVGGFADLERGWIHIKLDGEQPPVEDNHDAAGTRG